MKKSFDPQNLNYVPSEKAYYQEQLNNCKDKIFFSSEEELAQLIVELKDLKIALESGTTAIACENTQELQNEYETAAEYFNSEYYEENCTIIFRQMIIDTISEFINDLQNDTGEQMLARIAERVKRKNDEDLRVKQNAVLLSKRFSSDEPLVSRQEAEMYEKHCITTKKKSDCELCLNATKLLAQIDELIDINNLEESESLTVVLNDMKLEYKLREFKRIREQFLSILIHGLKMDRPSDEMIAGYSLYTMKANLINIFLMFHSGILTLKEFIKNYDLETQLCLLEDSMPLLSIIMNASDDQQKLFMNYSCQRLKLTSADNIDEDSANAITRLDYRLNVLKNVVIAYEIPLADFESWDDSFVQQLSEREDQFKVLSASFSQENSNLSEEQIAKGESICIRQIFKFNTETIIQILDKAKSHLSNIVINSTLRISDFLAMSDDKLMTWIGETDCVPTLARARSLMNYFFVPKEMLLQATPEFFDKIFYDPKCAVAIFNKDARYVSPDILHECLGKACKTLSVYLAAFKESGYMINIMKMSSLPFLAVRELQAIGLNFHQCRTIYDLLILKHFGFTTNYIKPVGKSEFEDFKLNYGMAIDVRFDAAQASVIRGIVDPYADELESVLNLREIGLPPKFSYLEEILSKPEDELNIEVLCTALENRVNIFSLTDGNITAQHLQLYHHLLASNAAKYVKTHSRFANLISGLKNIFEEYDKFPKNDMGSNSSKDANQLHKAIFSHESEKVEELLNAGNLPIGRNFKGTSYLACAALNVLDDTENLDVYEMIKKKLIQCTHVKLNTFLFANRIANKSKAHQLAFAITIGEDFIVQALLARDADLYSSHTEFGNKTPLELAANLSGDKRDYILSDIIAMQQMDRFLKLNAARQQQNAVVSTHCFEHAY